MIINIEAGVLRALKAYKIEKGSPDVAADQWASANLNEGVSRFQAVLGKHRKDLDTGLEEAYEALKNWAQSQ